MSSTELGRWGETIAVRALETHRYTIVECNWRCPVGEIDVVARDGEMWVFVEVKTRSSEDYGLPEEAVTKVKQKRILSVGQMYLAENNLEDVPWRIDVVAIMLASSGKVQSLSIYRNAVHADA